MKFNKDNAEKLSGMAIDDTLLREMQEDCANESKDHTKSQAVTSNNQIAIDIGVGSDDTESSVLKKYFPIYSYVQQITDDDSLTLSINSNELYAMRKKLISDNRADQMLNEDEYNDWNSKEIQISEPFIYEYTDGWSNVWEYAYTINYMLLLLLAISLSNVFSIEYYRKTDAIILCSQYGKKQLFISKILAGMTFSIASAIILFAATLFSSLLVYGTDGFHAALQLAFPLSSLNISVGGSVLVLLVPQYGTVMKRGVLYYRTRIKDANGKLVAIYAKTPEELYNKETLALEQIENATFHRKTPTVAEYCEKWLLMQSVHVRATTLTDYTSKVRRHIIAELGDKRMGEVSLDDIQLALVPVSKKSASVYKSVVILYKSIFRAAMESRIIDHNPTIYLTTKGGGVPQEDRQALTDEQAARLLDAIRDLPPYVFVMIGLYAGLRREEILALQWDSVYLDTDTPYLTVRRAWHTEHNRPVISDELKTKAAERNIPLPVCLAECLKAAKETSTSEYVVSNRDGEPLSYTQFKRLWQYIVTRTVKERSYYRYEDGKRVKHTVTPVLGEKAAHNGKVVYSLDFEVTPHQLRHTYITNLIHASVDPKTVQYLAGHESSKITMDIYAKVKYNRPDELVRSMSCAFASWDAAQ